MMLYFLALWSLPFPLPPSLRPVNYWHDMAFLGSKYVYFNLVQRLGRQRQRRREGGREEGREGRREGGGEE